MPAKNQLTGRSDKGTNKADALPWEYDFPMEYLESVRCYYEFGREATDFKQQVQAWRDRHADYMQRAKRFLECEGSIKFCFEEGFPTDIQRMSEVSQETVDALTVSKCFLDWRIPYEHSPEKLGPDYDLRDLSHPDNLSPNEPQQFLYRFPPFPDCAWEDLCQDEIDRAMIFFANGMTFFLPPRLPERIADYAPDASLKHWTNPFGGSLAWQETVFNFASGVIEGDSIGRAFLPAKYKTDRDGKRTWVGGYCHEDVQFEINWAQSDNQIKEAFADWLKTPGRRPHDPFAFSKSRKAWNTRDRLRQLKAFHLLKEGVEPSEICDRRNGKPLYPLTPGGRNTLYNDERAVRRAAATAEKILLIMFPPLAPDI